MVKTTIDKKKIVSFFINNWGLILIAFVCLCFMFADIINHRFWMHDLNVYYRTALQFVKGDSLYKVYYEAPKYVYKYSPVAPLFYVPFTFISFELFKVVYWLTLTGIIVFSFHFIYKKVSNGQKAISKNVIYVLGMLILALHFLRELHLGQVNYLLFTCFVVSGYLYLKEQNLLGSTLLAITIFFKPFGLIFIPWLLLKRNFKALSFLSISLIILFFIPILFYPTWNGFIGLYKGWMNELAIELSHKQSLLQGGNHTIFSLVARYTPIGYLLTSTVATKIFQFVLLMAIGLLFYYYQKKAKPGNVFLLNNFAFLFTLIPLFSFTSENAFCFAGLAVLSILINFNYLTLAERIVSILGFICIGGNFSEILGKQTSNYLDQISLISFGAIALLTVLYSARLRGKM